MTDKNTEVLPPSEPDIFDEDKLDVDESEADFDTEETNAKEGQ